MQVPPFSLTDQLADLGSELDDAVLRMGDEAIAGDSEQGHLLTEISVQTADFWLHMFHEWAMSTEQHHQ